MVSLLFFFLLKLPLHPFSFKGDHLRLVNKNARVRAGGRAGGQFRQREKERPERERKGNDKGKQRERRRGAKEKRRRGYPVDLNPFFYVLFFSFSFFSRFHSYKGNNETAKEQRESLLRMVL